MPSSQHLHMSGLGVDHLADVIKDAVARRIREVLHLLMIRRQRIIRDRGAYSL